MAQRDGAAIRIDALGIEPRKFDDRERLRCKSLIQFDDVNLIEFQAREFQCLGYREYRPDAHFLGWASCGRERNEPRERFYAESSGAFRRHDNSRGGAVAHLRAIARGNRAVRVERWLQFCQRLHRSVCSRASSVSNFTFVVLGLFPFELSTAVMLISRCTTSSL